MQFTKKKELGLGAVGKVLALQVQEREFEPQNLH